MTQPSDPTQPVTPLPPNIPPPPSSPPPTAPPGDPGATATMPPAPTRPADRDLLMVRAVLGVLVLGLTVVALVVDENEQRGYDAWTTWAIFATVMAAVHLLPLAWRTDPRRVWDIVALATVGLIFYWVALVLPFIGNATSFAQTLAVACALAHLWLLPGRR